MKIVAISGQEFDSYSSKHEYGSYYQSSSYGTLMNSHGLKPLYLGFYDGAELIGASLILHKNSFVGFKYGYAPRGILVNYNNYDQLEEITKELKSYLFKERFILLKIDPLIRINKLNKNGEVIEKNKDKEIILKNFKKLGFYHCGFNNDFESVKPRFVAILDLQKKEEELFNNLSKALRNKVRKATKLGLEIHQDNNALEKIYPFFAKKGNYSLEYYKEFINNFKDKIEIYVAKINTEKYVEGSRILYEKELEYNEYLNNIISRDGYKGKNMKDILSKKMESDKLLVTYKEFLVNSITLLKNNPEGITIAGTIIIKEEDSINLIIDGYDKNYGKLSPLHLLKWEITKKYCNSTTKYFNMNALNNISEKENNRYKGLNDSKFSFNSIAYEYIGEFNLIVNNPVYALYKNFITDDSIKINK